MDQSDPPCSPDCAHGSPPPGAPEPTPHSTNVPVRSIGQDIGATVKVVGIIGLGFIGLGLGFGILAASYGFPWWFAFAISFLLYAGSAEFLLVALLATGTPLVSIFVSTLIINSRHLFYGLTFPLHRYRTWPQKMYGIFSLTDEAYAVLTPERVRTMSTRQMLLTQVLFHITWSGSSALGAVLGANYIGEVKGLDFLLTALFIVLAIEAIKTTPSFTLVVCTMAITTVAFFTAGDLAMPAAMAGLCIIIPLIGPGVSRRQASRISRRNLYRNRV